MTQRSLTTLALALVLVLFAAACSGTDAGGDETDTGDTSADTGDDTPDDADGETDGDAAVASSLIDVEECTDPDAATAPIDGPIKVGWTAPLSGPLATAVGAVLSGMEARFALVNEAGGIDGHEIEVLSKDDAFDPERAKGNVAELIEVDGVHVLDLFGSGQLNAVADDQNIACVPLLFAQAGLPEYRDAEAYPWTTEYLPSAAVEMSLVVERLLAEFPEGGSVALAINPTTSGVALSEGFIEASEGTSLEIVAEADLTDPDAAATTLSTSGAEILVNAGVTTDCLSLTNAIARVGWQPEAVVQPSNCVDGTTLFAPAGEAADGQMLMMWLKEPGNPAFDDEAVAEYLDAVEAFGIDNPDTYTVNGWVVADMMVNVFESAAASDTGLSRLGIMEAARIQSYAPPMFIDGITWEMSPEQSLGIVSLQPTRWNAAEARFELDGDVIALS